MSRPIDLWVSTRSVRQAEDADAQPRGVETALRTVAQDLDEVPAVREPRLAKGAQALVRYAARALRRWGCRGRKPSRRSRPPDPVGVFDRLDDGIAKQEDKRVEVLGCE